MLMWQRILLTLLRPEFLHHLWQAGLHHRMVRDMVKIVPRILIIAMAKWGFVAAGRTLHGLHLVLIRH